MENFFATIGMMAIVFFILYIIKKINYTSTRNKQRLIIENNMYMAYDCVYEAAEAYAKSKSTQEVKQILLACIAFDEEMADNIITLTQLDASESDGGYNAFIKSVNLELGREVYTLLRV